MTALNGGNAVAEFSIRPLHPSLGAEVDGIDLAAAKARGLRHVWARGLGSRAPVTVGASQWSGIRDRIAALLAAGKAPKR